MRLEHPSKLRHKSSLKLSPRITRKGMAFEFLIGEAICEVLQDKETLEREMITPDFLDAILFQYTVEAVVHDILAREGSPSLDAAESAEILQARENELRQAVEAVVDARLAVNQADRDLGTMSQADRRQLQLDCIPIGFGNLGGK